MQMIVLNRGKKMNIEKQEEYILLEAKGQQMIDHHEERFVIMEKYALSYEYLHTTNMYLYQSKTMFRNNSDTTQLSQFMKMNKEDTVLDIGTNNGALLLYASMHQPKHLIGVEIQEEACQLAKLNMDMHKLDATIIHAKIQDVDIEKVDVIVCNPPYFDYETPYIDENNSRHQARHAHMLRVDELALKGKELLKDYGRFYLVHRSDYVSQIITTFSQYGLMNKRMQFVYAKNKPYAKSVLLEFRKNAKEGCIVEQVIIV